VNPKRAASAVLDRGQFLFALIAAVLATLAANLGFQPLLIVAIVFVPVAILLLTAIASLGGGMTVLFRDYMPVLAGLLFAWTVAFLPAAILGRVGVGTAVVQQGGFVYFLVLAVPILTTVTGASVPKAAVAVVAGTLATLIAASIRVPYMLASPFILYLLYQRFSGDISALGGGLAERQNFKRQLEAATLNPRDADAHYQLGLIYLQRRAETDAEASFRRALEIDPNEPDVLFQLGSLLRRRDKYVEAKDLLERGAHLDAKLASHQVWRELGAVALALGTPQEALVHLEYFVNLREYDPEGLVLYGRALKAAGRPAEAQAAFERAIEAVRTAPKFRKGELSQWERQARQELKG
jgi:hypothetical protein